MKLNPIMLMQRFVLLVLGAALLTMVVGCKTAQGFGKDVENAGEAIQDGTK